MHGMKKKAYIQLQSYYRNMRRVFFDNIFEDLHAGGQDISEGGSTNYGGSSVEEVYMVSKRNDGMGYGLTRVEQDPTGAGSELFSSRDGLIGQLIEHAKELHELYNGESNNTGIRLLFRANNQSDAVKPIPKKELTDLVVGINKKMKTMSE